MNAWDEPWDRYREAVARMGAGGGLDSVSTTEFALARLRLEESVLLAEQRGRDYAQDRRPFDEWLRGLAVDFVLFFLM